MTKKEIKLVQTFTDLETAWARMDYYADQESQARMDYYADQESQARMDYYADQESQYNDVDDAITKLKEVLYSILLDEGDQE